jgi:hypothetical protein
MINLWECGVLDIRSEYLKCYLGFLSTLREYEKYCKSPSQTRLKILEHFLERGSW